MFLLFDLSPQGGQCVYVCLFVYVLYRNPNHWMNLDEIWPGGGPQGWEGSWVFLP